MFFKLNNDVILRKYDSFSLLTDNRNFGYAVTGGSSEQVVGDKIVSQSGSAFLSALSRDPQRFEEILAKLIVTFVGVDSDVLANDALELYLSLKDDGFIASGGSYSECERNDRALARRCAKSSGTSPARSVNSDANRDTQDFLNSFFGDRPQLTSLHMEITSKCNERCVHCYIPHENKNTHCEAGLLFDIIKQCRDMNLLHLTLTGGEPMLHPDFHSLLQVCRQENFSINVLSNLTMLNEDLLAEMKRNPLLGVQTSLYSMDPAIHDEITRKPGSFELTKSAILKVVEAGVPIQISCPIMSANKESYRDVLDWAKLLGIRVESDFVVIGCCDFKRGNLKQRLTISEVSGIIKRKTDEDVGYLGRIRDESISKQYQNPDDAVCSVCHSSICVDEKGNVYPCAGWQGCVVGNLREESLEEVWTNSRRIKELRALKKCDFPECIACPDKGYCTMCMVRNANDDPQGSHLAVSTFFCQVAKTYREIVEKTM